MADAKRSILITGCSSGIGWAAAHQLRDAGWEVFPTARSQRDVERLQEAGFLAFRLDYEDPETIEACVAAVLSKTGGQLGAVFNNGAYAIPGALEDISTEGLKALFQANFFGWHELVRRIVPVMRAQGFGRIVQCSSVLGLIAMKYRGAYTASKFALEGYTDTLRQELYETGIRVSLIEPGPIDTRFTANALANFDNWLGAAVMKNSPHSAAYAKRRKRMEAGEPGRFKLQPEAVVEKLLHALEAKNPKERYYVTVPTYVVGFLRRIFSTRRLDRFLMKAADNEE